MARLFRKYVLRDLPFLSSSVDEDIEDMLMFHPMVLAELEDQDQPKRRRGSVHGGAAAGNRTALSTASGCRSEGGGADRARRHRPTDVADRNPKLRRVDPSSSRRPDQQSPGSECSSSARPRSLPVTSVKPMEDQREIRPSLYATAPLAYSSQTAMHAQGNTMPSIHAYIEVMQNLVVRKKQQQEAKATWADEYSTREDWKLALEEKKREDAERQREDDIMRMELNSMDLSGLQRRYWEAEQKRIVLRQEREMAAEAEEDTPTPYAD